jgi:hypothetical protein
VRRFCTSQVKVSFPRLVWLPLESKVFATAALPGGVTLVSRSASS